MKFRIPSFFTLILVLVVNPWVALLAAETSEYGGSPTKVYSVENIEVAILPSLPPKALIKAIGQATSTGWTKPQLIPYVYIDPPSDGIYEFDFVANRPSGVSLPVLTPIAANHIYSNLAGVKGFRIYASSNSLEWKFEAEAAELRGKVSLRVQGEDADIDSIIIKVKPR